MTSRSTILVTGATGNVGRQVVSQLVAARSGTVRTLTRTPATAVRTGQVDVRQGDLSDPVALEAAVAGADAVFLMWPFHSAEPADAVVDTIKCHARRVVFLSSGAVQDGLAAEQQHHPVGRSHARVERLIEESGLAWTRLRPSTFATNTLWWADQIRAGDVVQGAYGAVPMALLHEADIAAVAVRALVEAGHDRATYHLTGPEALTQAEQVRAIGQVLGRPLQWHELSRQEARRRLLADDSFPDAFVDPLLDGYADMLAAPHPAITHTVEAVTGTPARTYRAWVSDHAADFRM
ncbi:NAD(P)H-binding protein [Streptomyces sp. CA-132043]|uniref:NAD(P)H-binding protein n=1 Tax=Streptomyces sp. CA-132043 TaxID=3240048 RepID=UPI003D8DD8B7